MFSVAWMELSTLLMRLSSWDGATQHKLQLKTRVKDKIKFKSHTAPIMGHIFTTEGLQPSSESSKAVLEMSLPQDKAATRRFLDTITCLSKFCPNLSDIVHPLRVLTHLKQDFIWADQHTKAFNCCGLPPQCFTLMYMLPLFHKLMHPH